MPKSRGALDKLQIKDVLAENHIQCGGIRDEVALRLMPLLGLSAGAPARVGACDYRVHTVKMLLHGNKGRSPAHKLTDVQRRLVKSFLEWYISQHGSPEPFTCTCGAVPRCAVP